MKSVTEMDFNNPMLNELLKLIPIEKLIELVEQFSGVEFTLDSLLTYFKKGCCMQDLIDGKLSIKEIAIKEDVHGSTVYKYNTELRKDNNLQK